MAEMSARLEVGAVGQVGLAEMGARLEVRLRFETAAWYAKPADAG